MEDGVFDELGEAEFEDGAELEKDPFLDDFGPVEAQLCVGRVGAEESPGQEVERGLVVGLAEAGLPLDSELLL